MPSLFDITAVESRVTAEGGTASSVLTIRSNASTPLRVQMIVRPDGASRNEWLSVAGEAETNLKPGETRQVTVNVAIPQATPFGDYPFSLLVCSVDNPDEQFTSGPAVSIRHQPPPVVKLPKKFPWLLVVVAILCAGGGVLFWMLHRKTGESDRWKAVASTEQAMHTAEEAVLGARSALEAARTAAASAGAALMAAQSATAVLQQKIDEMGKAKAGAQTALSATKEALKVSEMIYRSDPANAALHVTFLNLQQQVQGYTAQVEAISKAIDDMKVQIEALHLPEKEAANKTAALKLEELESGLKDLDAKAAAAKEVAETARKLAIGSEQESKRKED